VTLKRIIVLAKSTKKGARCVAGIDVGTNVKPIPAGWIRPVSDESEGELEPRHMRTSDGAPVVPLDIVDVPLLQCANDPIHPEDWIVDASRNWSRTGALDPMLLDSLEEKPKDLWLESATNTDRVTSDFLSKRRKHQSLFLIRPSNLIIELTYEHNPFKNYN